MQILGNAAIKYFVCRVLFVHADIVFMLHAGNVFASNALSNVLFAFNRRRRPNYLWILHARLYRVKRLYLGARAKKLNDCFTRTVDFEVAELAAVLCVLNAMSARVIG